LNIYLFFNYYNEGKEKNWIVEWTKIVDECL